MRFVVVVGLLLLLFCVANALEAIEEAIGCFGA